MTQEAVLCSLSTSQANKVVSDEYLNRSYHALFILYAHTYRTVHVCFLVCFLFPFLFFFFHVSFLFPHPPPMLNDPFSLFSTASRGIVGSLGGQLQSVIQDKIYSQSSI